MVVDVIVNSHADSALLTIPVFCAGAYAETSDTNIASERKTKVNLNDLILTYYRLPDGLSVHGMDYGKAAGCLGLAAFIDLAGRLFDEEAP